MDSIGHLGKETEMSVYETLMLSLAFATLVIKIIDHNKEDKK